MRRTDPYLRHHEGLGGHIVFLTYPEEYGLCILRDGTLAIRKMAGVGAAVARGLNWPLEDENMRLREPVRKVLTDEQQQTLTALLAIWP